MTTCTVCSREVMEETAVALKDGFRHNECPRLEAGDYHPFERHMFEIGDVFYRDATHEYFTEIKPVTQGRGQGKGIVGYTGVKGALLPSPSTIAKFADPSAENLMGYVLRVEKGDLKDHERALLSDSKALGVNIDQPTYLVLRDAKGAAGTLTHAFWEHALRGEKVEWEIPPSVQGYVDGALAFLRDLGWFELLDQERVVYSAKHGYAGRFDARVKVKCGELLVEGTDLHETHLIDLKTSGFIGRSYHQQLHLYDLAAEECGVGRSDQLTILQVREDGTYTPWPVRSSREAALHSLALYKDGKETDAATRKDWRELVAA